MAPGEQLPSSASQVQEEEDEQQACLYAMQLSTLSIFPMTLKAAIELGVLDLLLAAETPVSAKEIAAGLGISNPSAHIVLDRILRLLGSHGVVSCSLGGVDGSTGASVRVYGPQLVCKYLAMKEYHSCTTVGPLALFLQDPHHVKPMFCIKEVVEKGGVPFSTYHGHTPFEFMDARYKDLFYGAMSSHSTIAMKAILDKYRGFEGLKTLVDVGGGRGECLGMITSKYPNIRGINFDLPHAISEAVTLPGIEHVAGDMFQSVPEGDAIFLKWILHGLSDEQGIKLLKNCWKALPSNGKLIVAESILPEEPETSLMAKYGFQMDVFMFTVAPNAQERTQKEFDSLREKAGFASLTVACRASNLNFCIMEMEK